MFINIGNRIISIDNITEIAADAKIGTSDSRYISPNMLWDKFGYGSGYIKIYVNDKEKYRIKNVGYVSEDISEDRKKLCNEGMDVLLVINILTNYLQKFKKEVLEIAKKRAKELAIFINEVQSNKSKELKEFVLIDDEEFVSMEK